MGLSYQPGITPLDARKNFPVIKVIIIFILIAAVIALIGFISKKIIDSRKSPEHQEKEVNRLTKKSDINKICKDNHFDKNQRDLFWEVCKITKAKNINFLLKSTNDIDELFHNAYLVFEEKGITEIKLNDFFALLYQIEMIVAKIKGVTSSKFIPLQTVVFYITAEGEQFPMYVTENTKDYFSLEMPEFLYTSEQRRPKILVRQRFTFKTKNGLAYSFIARIMRYDHKDDGKYYMVIAHTDQLHATIQRHFKREFLEEECIFSPIRMEKDEKKKKIHYIYSKKAYKGKISNISAGGCCIKTNLPVKDNQYLCLMLPKLGINEKIVGIIKRTRKLPNQPQIYALHIQFKDISLKTKNQIYRLVYKYEL